MYTTLKWYCTVYTVRNIALPALSCSCSHNSQQMRQTVRQKNDVASMVSWGLTKQRQTDRDKRRNKETDRQRFMMTMTLHTVIVHRYRITDAFQPSVDIMASADTRYQFQTTETMVEEQMQSRLLWQRQQISTASIVTRKTMSSAVSMPWSLLPSIRSSWKQKEKEQKTHKQLTSREKDCCHGYSCHRGHQWHGNQP